MGLGKIMAHLEMNHRSQYYRRAFGVFAEHIGKVPSVNHALKAWFASLIDPTASSVEAWGDLGFALAQVEPPVIWRIYFLITPGRNANFLHTSERGEYPLVAAHDKWRQEANKNKGDY